MSLNWFRNAYFRVINNVKQEYHKIVFSQLIKEHEFDGMFIVSSRLFYKNGSCDLKNVDGVIDKFAVDALQKAGVIRNDNVKYYVCSIPEVAGIDKDNPRIEFTVTDEPEILLEVYKRMKEKFNK